MKPFTKKHMKVGSKAHTISMKMLMMGLFVLFLSCNGQKKATMDSNNQPHSNSPLTLLVQDNYAQTDTIETLVVRDEKSLRKFFAKINMTRKPGLPVPEVDFSKEMVIIYCAGALKESAIPELSISDESEKDVVISLHQKKSDDVRDRAPMVSPFSVYKMPYTDKKVTFKKTQ